MPHGVHLPEHVGLNVLALEPLVFSEPLIELELLSLLRGRLPVHLLSKAREIVAPHCAASFPPLLYSLKKYFCPLHKVLSRLKLPCLASSPHSIVEPFDFVVHVVRRTFVPECCRHES